MPDSNSSVPSSATPASAAAAAKAASATRPAETASVPPCPGLAPNLPASATIYEPGIHSGWGLRIWRRMAADLWKSRELIWSLFVRDFKARYKQTLFGWAWALILPIVAVGTFVFLNRSGVLTIGDVGVPYVAYALLGLTVWQVFAGGLVACTNSIVAGGSMVVKINFPKETLVIAAIGQAVVELLVRLILVIAVFAWFRIVPARSAFLFPLSILPIFFLTMGLGFVFSLLNAVIQDVAYGVSLASTFLMFVTPVLYPARAGWFAKLSQYNPMAALVETPRDLVIRGIPADLTAYTWSAALGIVLFFLGWRVFKLAETRMAERMGSR